MDELLVPVVAGVWEDFDVSMDSGAARKYLAEMGIEGEPDWQHTIIGEVPFALDAKDVGVVLSK